MAKHFVLLTTFALFLATLAPIGYAQEKVQEKAQERSKTNATSKETPTQKAASEEKTGDVEQTTEVSLDRAIILLSNQINALTKEVKKMREESERNSTMLELLLYEERLLRLEDKIEQSVNYKLQLDAREQDILRRQRNIQQEITLRGGTIIRRDEAEAAIRQELQRALEDTRTQQTATQTKINEMQAQADRLRYRIETLRQKAARLELKLEEKE